jgi:ATP/maltotriose-dependent transcriptional regulator MalT
MPLLTTKFHIHPLRPNPVPRQRLIDRLNAGLGSKLSLISAPAGFGKTTLVSEWVNNLRLSVAEDDRTINRIAWLSLDDSDNDHVRFLAYFISAIGTAQTKEGPGGTVGNGALGLLHSPQPSPTELILTSLLNEISALPYRIVLVLDDYHLIENQHIHDALTFLVEHLPPQLHLVITTRDDPPLPLARLRARHEMTELRAVDLRFTNAEVRGFLNQTMGLDITAEEVSALETRTEGWITGLQMAAISLQRQDDSAQVIKSFTGSHRHVTDYLLHEVLARQSESLQMFLLQTAILHRLTGSLCDAVTGQDDGQTTIEALEHASLFIVPLDEERRWYRYHHLFADLLRRRLNQTQPEMVPVLHQRASGWYEQNGFAEEAIEHALRAEEFGRAANLIEEVVDAAWERGEHTELGRWLSALPEKLVFARPRLAIFNAWTQFSIGQHDAAEQSLRAAERSAQESQPPGSERMAIQGRVAAIRAFLASHRGDVAGIIKHSNLALEYLPEHDLSWRSGAAVALGDAHGINGEMTEAYQARIQALEASRATGNIYLVTVVTLKLALILRHQGQLRRSRDICERQVLSADENGISEAGVVGGLLATWGEVLAELHDLDGAIDRAKRGVELTERGSDVAMLGWSNLCLTRVLYSTGDLTGAQQIIHRMKSVVRAPDMAASITSMMAAWQARIWVAQGNLDAAAQWAEERGLDVGDELPFLREIEYLVLARLLIAQGRLEETAELLQRLLDAAEARGHTTRLIEVLILQALAVHAGGDTTSAVATLERCISLAEPGGYIGVFVDEGPLLARLLYKVGSGGTAPDYVRRLLAAFPVTETEQTGAENPQTPETGLLDPLSKRELEVLQVMAEGLSNQEIGARLFVSLNTVKVHTRNIYSKLGIHNRTQAVARARTLGLLPSE